MKRKLLQILLVLTVIVGATGCALFGKKVTLKDIAEKFNESKTVKSYKDYGYDLKATVEENNLVVTTTLGDEKSSVKFKLEGDILSNDALADTDLMSVYLIADSLGQLHGYKEDEVIENFNAFPDEFIKYTIDKEGFEVKENGETTSFKININKKLPLFDLSEFYLKTDEFDIIKELVEEKTYGNQTGLVSKLVYNIELGEDENTIYIGEKDKITESTYKSILSALEVMYGKTVADHFKEVYPNFIKEKTTVEAFTIDPDYKIEEEDSIFENTKVVLVTINNKDVKKIK